MIPNNCLEMGNKHMHCVVATTRFYLGLPVLMYDARVLQTVTMFIQPINYLIKYCKKSINFFVA